METTHQPTMTFRDRVQLPFQFDVERMKADIEAMQLKSFMYYDVMPLRAPAHVVDPSRPFPQGGTGDFADGSWTDWLDTAALAQASYLLEVVDTFRQHTKVNLVRLLRLEAGAIVKEHTDPTLGIEQEKSVVRFTIPIISPPEVEFYLNNEIVPMLPGECWYLRLTDPHRIVNGSHAQRINMSIDMIPNDWVRSLIEANQ